MRNFPPKLHTTMPIRTTLRPVVLAHIYILSSIGFGTVVTCRNHSPRITANVSIVVPPLYFSINLQCSSHLRTPFKRSQAQAVSHRKISISQPFNPYWIVWFLSGGI